MDTDKDKSRKGSVTAMKTIRNMMKKMGKGSIALLLAVLFVLLAGIVCVAGAEEKPEMASVNVKVVWDDDNNAAGKRPNYIYMYPSIDDKGTSSGDGSKKLYDSNNWSMTFTSTTIPAFDPETGEKNVFIPAMNQQYHPYGYTVSSTYDEATNTWTYTFTCQQYYDFVVTAWFEDFDDMYGRRPGFDAFNITLYGKFDVNGAVKYITKNADEQFINSDGTMTLIWHNAYTDYNKSYNLKASSSDVQYTTSSDYMESSFCNGVKLKLKTKDFKYSSSFYPFTSDKNKAASIGLTIPERINAYLVDGEGNVVTDINGTEFDYSYDVFPLKYTSTHEVYKSYNCTYSLPLLDEDGNEIDYSAYHIEYVDLPPYVLMKDGSYSNVTAHRLYIPAFPGLNVYAYFQQDFSNQFGTRPKTVEFEYREKNGRAPSYTDCVLITSDTSSSFNLTQDYRKNAILLPQVSPEGELLEWELIVKTTPLFYDIEVDADFSLNTTGNPYRYHRIYYTLKTEKLRTQVIWDDDNDAKNTRPDDVVVTVMTPVLDADGNKVTNADGSLQLKPVWEGAAAVLNEGNNWAAEWNLPLTDAHGNELEYYVQQGQLPVHVTTYHDPETDADGVRLLKITNVPLDAWNYAIDLRWETNVAKERYHRYEIDATSNAVRTLKYELTVNTSTVDYNPGMMEVRMPYYLCQKVNGDWVAPTQVSVPMQPEHNDVYSFHYYIDDHGTEDKSDDEIVYVNWKEMEAGTNQTLTVIYKIKPFEMIDTKVWELTATGYARNEYQEDEQLFEPEVKQSATISYGIDTGAQLEGFYKTSASFSAGNYQAPNNNGKCLYFYDTTYFDSKLYPKENFDPETYDYVGFYLRVMPDGHTQQYHYHFEEYPEDGGKVVSVKYGSSNYSAGGIINLSEDLTSWDSDTKTSDSSTWSAYTSYYVVVAYPRNPNAEDDDLKRYENRAKVTMIADVEHEDDKGPNDYYDLSSMEAYAYTDWEDYEFSYTGNIYSQYKGLEDYFETAGFTLNKFGTDTNVEFYTQTTVSGYNLNGYKYNMTDHDLYLRAYYNDKTYSDFVRISEGDYHLSRLYVYLKAYDYDRSTGEKIANTSIQDKPFKVQGQTGKYGQWVDIGEFTVTEANQNAVMNNSNGKSWSFDIADKGYTGFRVLTPEGLEGYTRLETNFRVTLHADSPRLAPFLEDYDNIQSMYLHNFSTLWLDVLNDEGEYYWFNPIESYKETDNVVLTGLTADDMADYGALPEHDEAKEDENKISPDTPSRNKTTLSQTNDTVNGMVRGKFRLQAGVYQSSTQMPAAYYEAMSIDEGVFYDLLPAGWIFDETQPIRAYGSSDSTSYPASCTYEIIDDFRGTGRQLVIFKVKSERAAGKNYYSSNRVDTCLNVEYSANITWNELRYHRNGVNLMAFQEGDGTRPGREFYSSTAGYYYDDGLPNESYLADYFKLAIGEDGNYAFYDINNDGVTDRNDTLMYYSTVSPEVAMTVETGIYKLVKGDSGLWKKHDTTHTDGTYRYKLGVTTSDGGDTSNLIMYDVLEDATNVEGHSGETGWKGTFVGLDLRLPKSQGIAPVVYYSTTPGLIYANENTDMNIRDESIWSTTPPADLSKVTAIAVDLTTRVDGEPFVFEGQGTTEFEIIMKAPSEVPEVRLAYNRLAYSSDFLTYGNVEAQHKYNIGKRVTIELRDLQDIQFYKMGEMDTIGENADGVTPIGGLRFDLYKCSHVCGEDCADGCTHTHSTSISSSACWTNTAFRTVYSESDGLVNFVRLDTGSYAVREPSARTGYLTISNVLYVFDVDASNSTVTGPVRMGGSDVNDLYAENGRLYLKNFRQNKKIYLYKYWQSEVSGYVYRPEKITVDLYRNGELYMEDLELTAEDKTSSSNTTWRLILEDLMLYDPYGNYYTYTFEEEPVDGYVLSSQSQPTSSSSSTNAYLYNRQQGALQIGKTVVDGDEDKLFTFKVQLGKDSNDEWPTGTVVLQRWAGDEMVARSEVGISDTGLITAQCKHGEIVRVLGLPVGITYSVTEENEAGYTQQVSSGSVSGTLASNTLSKVEFTNTYDATGEVTLSAVKTVNGQTPAADESFTFTLTSGAGTPAVSQEKTSAADGSITFDAIEYGLSDAGNTYTYTVQETSQSGNGYTKDDTVYTITATVTDNGDGTLSVETEISNGAETVEEITFANTYEATGEVTFTAEKTVNGEEPRADQVFDFTLSDGEGNEIETVQNDGGEIAFETITYELADVAGSPYTYTVEETSTDGSGYTVDTALYTVTVALEDNRDGTLKVTATYADGGENVDGMTFANTYEATGEVTFTAEKTVNGEEPREDQVFDFTLSDGEGNEIETVQNDGSEIAFETITYDLADVAGSPYTYRVEEISESGDGYTVDTTLYTVTVALEDNRDGTLKVTATYADGVETVDGMTFDNTYEATGEVMFTAEKTVNGEEPREDQVFDFTLSDGEGNEIETVQNDGSEIAFETITYDLADVAGSPYTYTVEETSTDGSGYTVDTTLYTVTVALEDNRDGTLKVTATYADGGETVDGMTFANTYEATGEATFTAEKTVNGETPREDQVFDFTLCDGEGNEIETVQNDGGEIAFETITYDLDDVVGSPYTYTVEETSNDGSGYTVDTTVYTVTVALEDNRNGTLKVTQTITDETGEVQAMTFANTYEATGEVTFTAEKTVNGEEPRADQVFDFTLSDGEGNEIETVQNDGGEIAFETITYDLADVAGSPYTYRVEEISESGDGYTVDTTLYTVTVALEDNRDGTLKVTATYADGGETVDGMTFANTYEATGQLPLSAVKTVNGGEPRADQVFDFRLTGANQTVLQTVSNNGSQIDFETLTYDLADVAGSPYTYTVTETGTDGNGYTLDTTVYTLFVWLEDNRDGTLNVTSLIKKAGETVDNIIFDNTYEAEGQFTPVAVKTVNGGEPRADQVYTFNLYSVDAETPAVHQTAENTGGCVTFQPLSFTLFDAGHTYTYQVRELNMSAGHLVMDDAIYDITLQIEDGRDGTLVITPSYAIGGESAEEIIFRNMVYAPLIIRKEITGPETEETFPFTIRLYNADGTESTEAFAYTGAKEGILHSGDVILLGQDESITIPDLLPGMSYAVEEEAGIRYTGTVNGQPAEQFAGTCTEGGDLVTFTNVLKTTAISVVKEWQGGIGGDIQLTLYANGVKVEPQPAYHQDGQTYSYINLPVYDSLGQLITYSVKEKYMDGYLTIYQNAAPHASETDCVYNGGTIINREVITFRIRKVWSGLGDEPAPPIRLTLYCNGVVYDRDQPTPDEDGWYVYRNLPKYVNGERAQYTIKETAMSGYETYYYAIDGSRAEIGYNGGKINNVKLPDTGDRSHPEWWIALAALAVCALGVLVIRSRRRR